ncbi:hypothetical protein FA13DRAFT_76890 [Coprinellus micaceus]|uniref:Uncharacterized protein n=1 Tax=Coprinellus micaceus TaxID=71717 RepID=A0A4Y7TJB3_COPMI|nr:hypothetical protein FA13DRAFT_76890 [Coprinellus micaceus]
MGMGSKGKELRPGTMGRNISVRFSVGFLRMGWVRYFAFVFFFGFFGMCTSNFCIHFTDLLSRSYLTFLHRSNSDPKSSTVTEYVYGLL